MKKLLISLILALVLLFSMSSVASAADPIVQVSADTPDGTLVVSASGLDTSFWNTGQVGQTDTFTAIGGFTADFVASASGIYGALGSNINADGAYGTGATFQLDSYQDFDVLIANHYHGVEGFFTAFAGANDDDVSMNLKTAGSMSVWSEATNPYWQPGLMGEYISKYSQINVNTVTQAWLQQSVSTTGTATMSNGNAAWGWGNYESGNLNTNYAGGTRSVSATGDGAFTISGAALHTLNTFGTITTGGSTVTTTLTAPSGGAITTIMNFINGMNGNYSMDAN